VYLKNFKIFVGMTHFFKLFEVYKGSFRQTFETTKGYSRGSLRGLQNFFKLSLAKFFELNLVKF